MRERFFIEGNYHLYTTGDLDKAAQAFELWQQIHPRYDLPFIELGLVCMCLGKWDKALYEFESAARLDPNRETATRRDLPTATSPRSGMTEPGLRSKKGKPLTLDRFIKTLKNPVYVGEQYSQRYKETRPGLWEPLVDRRTFDNVQRVLKGKKPSVRAYSRNHPELPLRVFLRCEKCNTPLTGYPVKGYFYYWCRKPGCGGVKTTRKEVVEAEFLKLLGRLRPDTEFDEIPSHSARTMGAANGNRSSRRAPTRKRLTGKTEPKRRAARTVA